MTTWKFKPFAQDDTKENPIQSQFFTTEEVGNVANGIIREGIQNALDERLDSNLPVEIKVTLVLKNDGLEPKLYKSYLGDLDKHLSSKDSGLRELPNFDDDRMSLLLFEDFNTKGLRGDPIESEDGEINDKSKPHNFYYFWRNVGITGKSEGKLGRWGVGKTVFPAASRINSFWGYTIQYDTKNQFLLGQSILRKHNLEGSNCRWGFKPYGYFGEYKEGNYFVLPVENVEKLERFKRTFQLNRTTQPGLSIVVPFYNEEISLNDLATACIRQYFFPIINGNLKVNLRTAIKSFDINSSNLEALVVQLVADASDDDDDPNVLNDKQLTNLFSFTKWALSLNETDFVCLKEPKPELQPFWYEKLWGDVVIDELISKFEASKRIAFKVPVKYHNKESGDLRICWFKVFLEKDDNLKKPEDHFIRENITIVDVKSLDSPGIRGIVFVEDKNLSNLLGDSENPAHTQWQKDSQNFKNKYVDGDKCIQFIIKSLQKISLKLQRPAAGLDKEILRDFFFVEDPQESYEPVRPDDDSGEEDPPGPVDVPIVRRGLQRVRTVRIPGGVVIKSKSQADIDIPFYVHAELGYLTTRGNPLKKWTRYDFELDKKPIQITKSNADVVNNSGNRIEFKVLNPEFEVKLEGFDPKRDLVIRVNTENIEND